MIPDDVWREAEICVAKLLDEVRRRGMLPMIVIAQAPDKIAPIHMGIYPVGGAMCDQAEVAKLLGRLAREMKGGVPEVGYSDHPPKSLPKGGAHELN